MAKAIQQLLSPEVRQRRVSEGMRLAWRRRKTEAEKSKPRQRTGLVHFALMEMELNGKKVEGFDYTRIEYDDGTFEETGLPAGMKSCPTVAELMENLFKTVK